VRSVEGGFSRRRSGIFAGIFRRNFSPEFLAGIFGRNFWPEFLAGIFSQILVGRVRERRE
jgi:hypothetical protein